MQSPNAHELKLWKPAGPLLNYTVGRCSAESKYVSAPPPRQTHPHAPALPTHPALPEQPARLLHGLHLSEVPFAG